MNEGKIFFSSPIRPGRSWGPPSFPCVPEIISPGIKWPERQVDHSPPSGAEVRNEWSYTSTPLLYLNGVERENITSYFTLISSWMQFVFVSVVSKHLNFATFAEFYSFHIVVLSCILFTRYGLILHSVGFYLQNNLFTSDPL